MRYIKLYDQILKWEWYRNPNTFRLFIHLLLRANYCDLRFEGRTVKRGQLVTSLPTLALETGLSVREIRTAIDHLKSTGELTDTSTSKYRVITIVNYDRYQDSDRQIDSQATGERQASDRQATASIERIESIERIDNNNHHQSNRNTKVFKPPTIEEVQAYNDERGSYWVKPEQFVDYYEARGWMLKTGKMKDWKAALRTWERNEKARYESEQGHDELPY